MTDDSKCQVSCVQSILQQDQCGSLWNPEQHQMQSAAFCASEMSTLSQGLSQSDHWQTAVITEA